jgi:hypothetical protein
LLGRFSGYRRLRGALIDPRVLGRGSSCPRFWPDLIQQTIETEHLSDFGIQLWQYQTLSDMRELTTLSVNPCLTNLTLKFFLARFAAIGSCCHNVFSCFKVAFKIVALGIADPA